MIFWKTNLYKKWKKNIYIGQYTGNEGIFYITDKQIRSELKIGTSSLYRLKNKHLESTVFYSHFDRVIIFQSKMSGS